MKSILAALLLALSSLVYAAEPAMLFEGSNVGARLTKAPCELPEAQLAFALYNGIEADAIFGGEGHFQNAKTEPFALCWAYHSDPEKGPHVDIIDANGNSGFIRLEDLKPEKPEKPI